MAYLFLYLHKVFEEYEIVMVNVWQEKPNDKTAHIRYFANYLTYYTRKTYGSPCRELVAQMIEVIFDKKPSDRMLRKWTQHQTNKRKKHQWNS